MIYSEIFSDIGTIQGEGQHTGKMSVFLRFAACNLKCLGFGQKNPRDPSTWIDPYSEVDWRHYDSLEELPIFELGCDSAYAHNHNFKKFFRKAEIPEVVDKILGCIPGRFFHNFKTNNDYHLVITGGEPMLQQTELLKLIQALMQYDIRNITIETNGTIPLIQEFKELLELIRYADVNVLFSISPKLSNSGEKPENAIKYDVIKSYADASENIQLKFVVDGTEENWNEVDDFMSNLPIFNHAKWSTWIMPVGATKTQQEKIQASICEEAYKRGYHFSARVHNWVFSNIVGK